MSNDRKNLAQYTIHASKALKNLSKLIKDIQNEDLSSIEESEIPPSTLLFKEFSKPILDKKKIKSIKTKGIPPKPKKSDEERNIQLILDTMKKQPGYEQFTSLHKIRDKSIMLMCALGNIEQYKKGETIYAKKDVADKFYYVIRGKVVIQILDQKKIIDEYENKIQGYKNKIKIKNFNNFFRDYKNNIKSKETEKQSSQLNSLNSNSFSLSNTDDSNSELFKINKDLLHNKMQKIEKIPTKKKTQINILNNLTSKNMLDEVIISKRRKPLYYINTNENNDKEKNNNIKSEEKINFNNININNINNNAIKINTYSKERKDIYIKSFSELQNILNEQRNQGQIINEYTEGNFFGEWELMYKKLRQNTAYTVEDTDLFVIDLLNFNELFKNEMLLADFERKFFLKKIIPVLNINYMPIIIPIYYPKGKIVYTEFDKANYCYIIYKGSGALKQLKSAKNKKDIMLNLNKLETLMIIDKGCIVGLECCKAYINNNGISNLSINNEVYYDNIFVINERNTLVYKINLEKFKINKEELINMKTWMKDLYKKQNKLIRNYKEKLSRPKTNREMILKQIDKSDKKIYFSRDPKQNTTENKISKINDFRVKRESININATFNKKKLSLLNEINNLYFPKCISNYKSYSNRSSNSNIDSSSLFSNSNAQSKTKANSTKKNSNYYNKAISPFIVNNEFIPKKKSFNPINQRNSTEAELNTLCNNKQMFCFKTSENKKNNNSKIINAFNEKMNKLWNSKSKGKNNENKNHTYQSAKKLKYDDTFYKLIFKKHFRKVSISSRKNDTKKKLNIFLYDSGQFDIPLLALNSKIKRISKKNKTELIIK